jgi:uncharacterized protein YaiI (UPF0178 family)
MTIWVDADGCPSGIRRIVERAAIRVGVTAVLVANRPVGHGDPPRIRVHVVGREADAADRFIQSQAARGDLAVTADIPLAARLVERGVDVIHPQGDFFDENSIRERLSMREFLNGLRRSGVDTTGKRPKRSGPDRFAKILDRELARRHPGP